LVALYIVWLIVRKGINWSPSIRSALSSDLPKESRVSDFGILRQRAPLPAEMWSLTKNQYSKKSQRRRIKRKEDLQTVWQTLWKKRVEFSDSPKMPDGPDKDSSDSEGDE